MSEKTKFMGVLTLSFSVLCLAAAIGYFASELNGWRKQLPEIMILAEDTSGKIAPAMENVTEIGKLIPPILEEVAAVRRSVDSAVSEVESTRKALPGILGDMEPITRQIENTAKQLREVIDPLLEEVGKTLEAIPGIMEQVQAANAEVAKVRELVPGVLEEIRLTREAMPGMMDRVDAIVASAGEAGKEAGKGAMTGMIGGIIASPFRVVGKIGRGVAGFVGPEVASELTSEDIDIFTENMLDLSDNGKVGQVVNWQNQNTSNSGKITLLKKYDENEQECREVKIETFINGQAPQTGIVNECRQADGLWIATE